MKQDLRLGRFRVPVVFFSASGSRLIVSGLKYHVGVRFSGPAMGKFRIHELPKGPKVVPFGGSYLENNKVIPKRNYFGAFG